VPAEAGDAEGYAVNTDSTSPRHGADADALLRATGRLETELKLQKSSLDEKQALLRELDRKKADSCKEYRKLTDEAIMLTAQLAGKRDHLVQHCEEHRTLQRKRLQCAKECASSQRTVSKLQKELEDKRRLTKKRYRSSPKTRRPHCLQSKRAFRCSRPRKSAFSR
jgi:chromosome segregation ATPase